MEERRINCYFCGKNVINIVEDVDPRNVRIKCEHCKVYELEHKVLLFHYSKELNSLCYSDRNTDENKELSQELKDKLSEYVRRNFNTDTGYPVLITMKKFRAVTGKNSIHII